MARKKAPAAASDTPPSADQEASARPRKAARKAETTALATAAAAGEMLPPAVDDAVVDEVVETIHALTRGATVDLSIRIGGLIVEKFYGGDLATWHSRGAKDASFRRLADRLGDDGEVSAAKLSRMVGIYEMDTRLGVSARKHLTATHLRAVLGLPDAQQRRLLDQTESKGWETRKLEEEAAKVRKKNANGRGRPPLPAFVKSIGRLGRMLEDGDALFGDLDAVEDLDADEAEELWKTVTGMKLKCEQLQKALAPRVPGSGEPV